MITKFMCSTPPVKVGSTEYKEDTIVVIQPKKEFEDPIFGDIKQIFIINNKLYFYVGKHSTIEYNEHYCAYISKPSSCLELVQHVNLGSHIPLQHHTHWQFPNCCLILPKYITHTYLCFNFI